MRYKVLTTMTLFGLLIVPLAHAQSSQTIQADIPFDFGVANTVLPAGYYQLTYSPESRAMFIRDLEQDTKAIVITLSVQATRSQEVNPQLVFHRHGTTYFLWQVFNGYGAVTGSEVPKSRSERDLIARIPGSHVERAAITIPAK